MDETAVKVGGKEGWIWVCYEPIQKAFLGLWFSWNRNSIVAEMILKELIKKYGKHPVYTDGASWYPEACKNLGLAHYIYKQEDWLCKVMERAVQYVKDRTESFDDYFPCRKKECRQQHIWSWIKIFFLHKQLEYLDIVKRLKGVITLS